MTESEISCSCRKYLRYVLLALRDQERGHVVDIQDSLVERLAEQGKISFYFVIDNSCRHVRVPTGHIANGGIP